MTKRVVVTGLGLVTPVGNDVSSSWQNIVNGVSGVAPITYFDTSNYLVKIAAQVKDFDPTRYMPANEVKRYDGHQHYMIAAYQEAQAQAGFEVAEAERFRVGMYVASSTGGLQSYADYYELIRQTNNPRKMTPFAIPMLVVNAGNNVLSMMAGACASSAVPVSACATGADAIGTAFDMIRLGRLVKAMAGCGDAPIISLGIAAFDRIGACSRQNDDPATAVKPFDKNRTGLVFGEGCAILVLEELEYAKQRGANILAEVVGYGSTTDAYHRTAPHPDGFGAVEAIQQALTMAQIDKTQIDYINAHGTATSLNDAVETKVVKLAFGNHAHKIPMSSTKSMTGHGMGSTAAMEAAFSILALRDQVMPPTINYQTPDPECNLDYVPNQARSATLRYVMSNSFGFGGHNASLIFRTFDD